MKPISLPRLVMTALTGFLLCPAVRPTADVIPPEGDASGVLDAFMAREQPSYRWTRLEVRTMPAGVMMHCLELVSQTWMGMEWRHPLNVLVPPGSAAAGDDARSGHCIMVITAGDEEIHAQVCAALAARVGVPFAILHQIPNQPLFREKFREGRGLWEDALIAQTFLEFAESGEADWPLLLPMTRAVVSAMDALGEFSQDQIDNEEAAWKFGRLEKFLTTGASKRGWTTWLSAAADKRVIAIAPMVYDNLNLAKQIPLHYETWGEPSPSIHDYTERGLLEIMQSPRGEQLMSIVDPYAYRERYTIPKLLLIGTNDPYWPLASIHEYIAEIPGPTWCHYEPNAGHDLGANVSVLFAIAGFFDAVTGRSDPLPTIAMKIEDDRALLSVQPGGEPAPIGSFRPRAVRLLAASSTAGTDFRRSRWQRAQASGIGNGGSAPGVTWRVELDEPLRPQPGRAAAYIAEVELQDRAGNVFTIHSVVEIIGD